jgi:hypothetical protein
VTWLRNLFGRAAKRSLDHHIFGRIEFSPEQGWQNERFSLWGFEDVLLMIDAPETGPTQVQEEAFGRMLSGGAGMLQRFVVAVSEARTRSGNPPGEFLPRAVSVPSLGSGGPGGTGSLWTIWFDCEGDDHWSYGVQSRDDWATLSVSAED